MKYLFRMNFSFCTKHHKSLVNIELNSLYKVEYNYIASYYKQSIKIYATKNLLQKIALLYFFNKLYLANLPFINFRKIHQFTFPPDNKFPHLMTLFEQFSSVSFVSTLKLSIRTSSMKVGTISSSNKSSNLSTAYKEYIYIYMYIYIMFMYKNVLMLIRALDME